jgi:hypothetical protein
MEESDAKVVPIRERKIIKAKRKVDPSAINEKGAGSDMEFEDS